MPSSWYERKTKKANDRLRRVELGLIAASTLFSAGALYFSFASAEASRDQAASARTALYVGAKNESFIRYSRAMRDYCIGFAPDAVANRTDVGEYIPAVRYPDGLTQRVPLLKQSDIEARLAQQTAKQEDLGRAMDELRVWLPTEESNAIYNSFAKALEMTEARSYQDQSFPAALAFDTATAACLATQQNLMRWYSDDTGNTPLIAFSREDVAIDLGGGPAESEILVAWGLDGTIEINKAYRKRLTEQVDDQRFEPSQ